MSKVRVDALAKEMDLEVKDLFTRLKSMGFDVVNTSSTVDRAMVDMVRDMLLGQPPKERKTAGRRIVSVHKTGAKKKPDVEVRVEEEQPPPSPEPVEVAVEAEPAPVPEPVEGEEKPKKRVARKKGAAEAAEGEPGEAEPPAPETSEPLEGEAAPADASPEAPAPVEAPSLEAPAAEAAASQAAASPASEPASPAPGAAASAPGAPPVRKKKEDAPFLTALEVERHIRAPGTREVAIVKPTVVERAPVAPVPRPHAPGGPGAGAGPVVGTPAEEERKAAKEKPKRAVPKKEKKVSRADLMRQVEDLTAPVPEEEVPPELKVVEIRHAPVMPGAAGRGRRPEPPRRKLKKPGRKDKTAVPEVPLVKRTVRIEPGITVADLARLTGTKAPIIIKKLMDNFGVLATINQPVDPETAALIVSDLGYETELHTGSMQEIMGEDTENEAAALPRSPVVTVMGHVDHGKTSLLDAIRSADVVSGEAGGITQHIGAYLVHHSKGSMVFLDTPGHEAFTAMRARGAKVTDIVVLVVAADDGVMPQTMEAIDHAKAAGVPIIVAVNKIDKPEANPDRVKQALSDKGVVPEEWGGEAQFAYVSAKKKTGIDDLLDKILLQAEVMQLKADPTREARGAVIESRLDKGRGPVATVLVQKGTLKIGDTIVAGALLGKVRAMQDDKGRKLKEAGPSTPVEVVGFPEPPMAGDTFLVFNDEMKARRVAEKAREASVLKSGVREKVTLEDLFTRIKDGGIKELKLVIKADVQGSVEALRDSLNKLSTDAVRVKVIHTATGAINESDITLAMASDAIVIGFNVRPDSKALDLSRKEAVDVRFYNIIYNAVNEVRDALRGLLAPIEREQFLGRAEVRQTFSVPKIGLVAGSFVQDGVIRRNARVRVLRDGVVVNDGKIGSLRRFKDDAREVTAGYECGIGVENFNDIKVGDILEAFEIVQEQAEL